MAKRYTFFRLILLSTLFFVPFLLSANGEPSENPLNGGPGVPDSVAARMGHCNPITVATINCATQTIELTAYVSYLFTGLLDPYVATWNTGEVAHKITVTPPGAWSWDPINTGCEENHWANTYGNQGTFFNGVLDIAPPLPICEGGIITLVVDTDGYNFPGFQWTPENPTGAITPFEVSEAGTYLLEVVDDMGCIFSDQVTVPSSPPLIPVLSGTPTMCPEGDTGVVTVNPIWNTYSWDTGDTGNPINIYEPGYYNVTVTDQNGCTGAGGFTVQSGGVQGVPLSLTAQSICVGDLDTIRVVGGFVSYNWSNGASGITNIVTTPGTYAVTVTNAFGCTGTSSVTVGAKPTPVIGLTSTPMCPGDTSTLMLTGGPFPNYLWSNGMTTNPINVTTPGTYSVTVSGATFCSTNTSVVVTQLPPPITLIAPPAQLNCVVQQTVLNAGGSSAAPNFNVTWTTVGGSFVSGQSTLTPTVDAPGVYTLLITNSLTGCTSSASVTVTEDVQLPPAPVGNPNTLTCVLTNYNIGTALPPTDTTLVTAWTASGGGNFVSGQASWNPIVDAPGTYTLVVTNPANGCTSTGSVVIAQNIALPNAVISQPAELTCTMNTTALNGSGSSAGANFTYLWTANPGTITGSTSSASTTAGAVGVYTLLVTNTTNGCTATSSVTVTADLNIPIAVAAPPATLTCAVQDITINANGTTPGLTYTWTGPVPGSIIAGQGTLTPTVDAAGTYTLLVFNSANSCSATLSVLVPEDVLAPAADAGPDDILNCVIPNLNLNGSASSSGPNFTYLWTTVDGNIVSGNTGVTPTVDLAGTYNLLVTNTINGCTSTASVQVSNDANAPNALIANPATLTCTTLQTIINGLGSTQDPGYVYTWSGPGLVSGQNTLQPTVDAPGIYTLNIVNPANGCTDTETITVPQDIVAPVALAGNDELINCTTPAETIGSAGNPSGANFTLVWSTLNGSFTSGTNGPTASIDAAGTYTLLITNNTNGCTDTDDVLVLADFAPPLADAGPTFELNCVQTNTVLQGTGSTGPIFTYLWTTVDGNITSGGTTLTPTVGDEGTYNLLITNTQNGCTSTDQVLITQSADVPDAVIATPNLLTCILTSQNLNAAGTSTSPTISYTWTASNGGSITAGGTTLSPTVDAPGIYTLQVFDASNNCTATEVITVPENIVNPAVDAGNPALLTCTTQNLPVTATILSSPSTNISYQWSTTNGNITGPTNIPAPTIDAPGLYTVVITDALNGCTGTDAVQINEDVVLPVASIAQPQVLTCDLLQTLVNGSASSQGAIFTYLWTTLDGNIVNGSTLTQPTVDEPGTYNLLVTNTFNGCTQTASMLVTEDVVPPVALAGPSVGLDCDTQTNALDGSASSQGANFTYQWSTADGQILSGVTTTNPQIGDPGTYSLLVENTTNGCTSVSSVVVVEDVNPPVALIGQPALLTCVLLSTPLNGSGTAMGAAPTYNWTTTNGNIVSGGNTLTPVIDAPGNYTLTVVNTVNGCTDTEQIAVLENVAPPPLNTLPVSPLTCTVLNRTLQANAPAGVVLQWSTLDGNIVSGANTANPVVDEPGTYTVLATLPLNGCTAVASTPLLQEQNVPTGLEFLLDPPLCTGVLGYLTVEQINGGVGPFDYSIDGGATFFPAQDIDGLNPGAYDLVIRDANGCKITEPILVPTPPTPAVSLPPSFSIVLGDNQELQAVVPPSFPLPLIDQVIWTPTTGLTFEGNTITQQLNPVALPFVTTEYKVTIISKEGCKAESRTIIRVDRDIDIYPPNVIWTDDPDSDNSAFTLFTRKGSVKQILSLQVYDRWGEQLFVNQNFLPDDPSLGWKGDYKGEFVNPGVFVWWAEVELIDGQSILLKGDVTVVR